MDIKIDEFTTAYVKCALWSTLDESNEQGGVPLEENYGTGDIHWKTMDVMVQDCESFQSRFAEENHHPSRAGHDFWLTRNGHGAGFWDGDWPELQASRLTDASMEFGEFCLYVG